MDFLPFCLWILTSYFLLLTPHSLLLTVYSLLLETYQKSAKTHNSLLTNKKTCSSNRNPQEGGFLEYE